MVHRPYAPNSQKKVAKNKRAGLLDFLSTACLLRQIVKKYGFSFIMKEDTVPIAQSLSVCHQLNMLPNIATYYLFAFSCDGPGVLST